MEENRTANWMNRLQGLNETYFRPDGEVDRVDEKEEINEGKAAEMIKVLIDTDWGGSNKEQGKAAELIKGLSFSDEPQANAFMQDLNKITSGMDWKKYK